MSEIFFRPFLGKNYNKEGFDGIKLLILGESHYCKNKNSCPKCGKEDPEDCFNFTNNVVQEYLGFKKGEFESKSWMSTFTRFTNVLLGDKVGNDEIIDFWESIVFYNYVQSALETSRKEPKSEQFYESEKAFKEVLRRYKPDLIIVWGIRLWEYLPDIGHYGEERKIHGAIDKIYYYKSGVKDIPAFPVYHPASSKYNYDDSRKIQKAIDIIKKK